MAPAMPSVGRGRAGAACIVSVMGVRILGKAESLPSHNETSLLSSGPRAPPSRASPTGGSGSTLTSHRYPRRPNCWVFRRTSPTTWRGEASCPAPSSWAGAGRSASSGFAPPYMGSRTVPPEMTTSLAIRALGRGRELTLRGYRGKRRVAEPVQHLVQQLGPPRSGWVGAQTAEADNRQRTGGVGSVTR
jgi:hypothetical protein